jgi:hypothetical protein
LIENRSTTNDDQQEQQHEQQILQHLNRNRAKRANIKKPTVKKTASKK